MLVVEEGWIGCGELGGNLGRKERWSKYPQRIVAYESQVQGKPGEEGVVDEFAGWRGFGGVVGWLLEHCQVQGRVFILVGSIPRRR